MAKIIYDSGIADFLTEIAQDLAVYVPSPKRNHHLGQFTFEAYKPKMAIELNYPVTILPPTEFLLPHGEVLFTFSEGKAQAPKLEKQVLFGLSVEDLEGIQKLTSVMSEPMVDEPYEKSRQNTFIIGLDKYSPPHSAHDLYLQEFEPGVYAATAKTKQGQKWLATKHFKNAAVAVPKISQTNDPVLTDPDLPRAIKDSREHPVWDKLAETCFGCGICSYVCPLCFCFEVEDKTSFGDTSCGSRCRNWDSCMLKSFTDITNHNFRPELRDRIYNWYHHKFYRFPKEYGFNGCVDCNRCAVYCPAKINFHRVLAQVLSDYKKRPKK